MFRLLILIISALSIQAVADVDHTLLRRIAVFPIADANYGNAEDAWWQMREALTKDQRFFVASRRFMINRGVFQPRKVLKPADAIILGKILDAQALVTSYIDDRTLKMKIYEGENGYLLWEGEAPFHPAISINDQLIRISTQLMNVFITTVPYQGFQVIDDLVGKPLFEDDKKFIAQVFVGANNQYEVGDAVQWIKVSGDVSKSFFGSGEKVTVYAEGKIKEIKGDRVAVEVTKLRDPSDLKENSLIRFPKEVQRLKEIYAKDDKGSSLSSEYLSSEIRESSEVNKGHNSTASALTWIVNIATFILLAF